MNTDLQAFVLVRKFWFQYNQLITQLKRNSVATAKHIGSDPTRRTQFPSFAGCF
jgi:hypothetical protein